MGWLLLVEELLCRRGGRRDGGQEHLTSGQPTPGSERAHVSNGVEASPLNGEGGGSLPQRPVICSPERKSQAKICTIDAIPCVSWCFVNLRLEELSFHMKIDSPLETAGETDAERYLGRPRTTGRRGLFASAAATTLTTDDGTVYCQRCLHCSVR